MKTHTVSTEVQSHTFTVSTNGTLFIDNGDRLLSAGETEHLLEILLIWKYGLEEVSPDNLEE